MIGLRILQITSLLSACLFFLGCNGGQNASRPPTSALTDGRVTDGTAETGLQASDPSEVNREAYDHFVDNAFLNTLSDPLSTFSIDVDTASYSNIRRMLENGQRPPKGAVRLEECVNYFDYRYSPPTGDQPFSVEIDTGDCPWNRDHQLLRIAIQGRPSVGLERPSANLVFLIDVSGSMQAANKLPLLQRSLSLLVANMRSDDQIAIVTYAGRAEVALPSTPCTELEKILERIENLESGGSTNGADGIHTAYAIAQKHFLKSGINRVILCTDGDFNVGTSHQSDLVELIQKKARSNVFLTVLGFGMGNYNDSTLEKIANSGNGSYAYIDDLAEARKVLVEEMGATLETIAKDVKIQVDFNPAHIYRYRLLGFENRMMAKEDFVDDANDAGEIGAGHRMTALYEIEATSSSNSSPSVQSQFVRPEPTDQARSDAMAVVHVRFKSPLDDSSQQLSFEHRFGTVLGPDSPKYPDFRFAAAVAGFGMILRDSPHKGDCNWELVKELAQEGIDSDASAKRTEFLSLVDLANDLPKE